MVTTATPLSFVTLTELDKRNLPRPAAMAQGFTRPAREWEPEPDLAQWLVESGWFPDKGILKGWLRFCVGRRYALEIGRNVHRDRNSRAEQERSSVAETLESMPLP
ncbi:MAG: hypothetical protein E5V53_34020 [Mesorhizobium sp.]|nr:MAG: hypothetical protein E5V53_34020 [Mesorhizobium sp.]